MASVSSSCVVSRGARGGRDDISRAHSESEIASAASYSLAEDIPVDSRKSNTKSARGSSSSRGKVVD